MGYYRIMAHIIMLENTGLMSPEERKALVKAPFYPFKRDEEADLLLKRY